MHTFPFFIKNVIDHSRLNLSGNVYSNRTLKTKFAIDHLKKILIPLAIQPCML